MKCKRPKSSSGSHVRTAAFLQITEAAICDRHLTGEELRLLMLLMLHDLPDHTNGGRRKGYVFLKRQTIAEKLHREKDRVSRLLTSLERKGFIKRDPDKGYPLTIHLLLPSTWRLKDASENQSQQEVLAKNTNGIGEKHQGVLVENANQKILNRREETKTSNSQPSADDSPEKKTPDHARVIEYHHQLFLKTFGRKYHFHGSKDGNAVKTLLKTYSADELISALDAYFLDTEPFVIKQGYTWTYFLARITGYIIACEGTNELSKSDRDAFNW